MNKFVLGLACVLLAVVCVNTQNNERLDLWVRYQDRIYNFWRSHGYTQARNQKQVWRLPNTFRIQRSVDAVVDELPVESTIPTCYFTGSTVICGRTSSGFNDTVECSVAKRFDDSLLEQLEIFALSDRRVVSLPTGQNATKFYLYARYDPETVLGSLLVQRYGQKDSKRPVVSLHAVDSIQDNGFTVIDSICWEQLVDFLSTGDQDSVVQQVKI
jgi:hypothetical protein